LHFKTEISTIPPVEIASLLLIATFICSGLMIYVPSLCFKEWILWSWEPYIFLFPPGNILSLVSEKDYRR
jgi:hypothetical protein